jgi:hypothetical protein
VRQKTFEFGTFSNKGLQGTTDHGVLTHKDNTFTTERVTDLVHLVGADIIDIDNEDGAVGVQVFLETEEVVFFGFSLRHDVYTVRGLLKKCYKRRGKKDGINTMIIIIMDGWMDGWGIILPF